MSDGVGHGAILLTDGISIGEAELRFTTARSGGPGGQNVNKVETRVTVLFDLDGSPSLSPDQKRLVRERLPNRISKSGVLRVVCQRYRSQAANRESAVARLAELLRSALAVAPERHETRPTRQGRERRLAGKKHRSRVKAERAAGQRWED